MRTAPFAFRSLFKLRFKADEMIGSWTSITQDNFTALLAYFTVVLVISLEHTHTVTNHRTQQQSLTNHITHTHSSDQSQHTETITDQSRHIHISDQSQDTATITD